MHAMLASIMLNEADMLLACYLAHIHWPGYKKWVMVEGAARSYAEANQDAVTDAGLSTDNTAEIMQRLLVDRRLLHIKHGWADGEPGQQKCALRNRYLEVADQIQPDYVVVIDLDEYYLSHDQRAINHLLANPKNQQFGAFMLKQRHLWRPPSIQHLPLTSFEIVGGYFDVPHCRIWRWKNGMRHIRNHNTPEVDGHFLNEQQFRGGDKDPQVIHLGFARKPEHRGRTNRYYVQRGEGTKEADGSNRSMYVECRAAWEGWKEGAPLPHGMTVIPFSMPYSESLAEQV